MGEARRPFQFRLRTLLSLILLVAVTLGAAKWLGVEIVPFVVAASGLWITARTKARHLLVWLVPSLWSLCAFGSWRHPGDEYGMFIVSVLPSLGLALLLDFGHLSEVYLPLIAAGALAMAVLGFVLDRLPISRRLWAACYVTASAAWFVWMLWQFPTLERAIGKNGSISAYAFCAANLGLYFSGALFLLGGMMVGLWRTCRKMADAQQ